MTYLVSIVESIQRILGTPLGTRVMMPTFGSKLYDLIDKRVDGKWKLRLISYTYQAIKKWEPRVKLKKVVPTIVGDGRISILLTLEIVETKKVVEERFYVA
jgi:hypothetical protein